MTLIMMVMMMMTSHQALLMRLGRMKGNAKPPPRTVHSLVQYSECKDAGISDVPSCYRKVNVYVNVDAMSLTSP